MAKRLLEQAQSSYIAQPALYLLPVPDITDRKEPVNVESFTPPKTHIATNFIAGFDPIHAGNRTFQQRLAKLNSLKIPAASFPFTWLRESQQAEFDYPGSTRLKLNAAQWLVAQGNNQAASQLLKEVLETSKQPDQCTLEAYIALAGLYEKAGDTNRTLAALAEAVKQQPGNASLHQRLGSAYAAAGYPQSAKYHKLMAWFLFPGRPGLTKELISAGLLPQPPQDIKNTATLFRETAPAVILISHKKGNGTGFLISRNGRALTNYHVINGATDLAVKLKDADGNEWSTTARVIASDAILDIALIALESTPASLNPLILGDSNSAKTGDSIVAIGNPGMGSKVLMQTASEGIISANNRTLDNRQYLQISAPVNPGNSGGPLLDHSGHVVGMVTLKAHLENVGFAVPATELNAFVLAQEF
jgi:S1-C subfamily serine protease